MFTSLRTIAAICFGVFALVCFESNVLAGIRLLTNGSLARGALDSKSFHDGTLYETIQSDFEKSRTVKRSDISGVYAGRCFYSDSPNQPVASLLVVADTPSSKLLGPAFRDRGFKRIVPLVDLKASPTYFDELPSSTLSKIREEALTRWSDNAFAAETPESLVVDGLRTFKTEARTYELRRSQEFIYLRLVCAEPGFCLNDRG